MSERVIMADLSNGSRVQLDIDVLEGHDLHALADAARDGVVFLTTRGAFVQGRHIVVIWEDGA